MAPFASHNNTFFSKKWNTFSHNYRKFHFFFVSLQRNLDNMFLKLIKTF